MRACPKLEFELSLLKRAAAKAKAKWQPAISALEIVGSSGSLEIAGFQPEFRLAEAFRRKAEELLKIAKNSSQDLWAIGLESS